MEKHYKFIASDIDGTLLNSAREITSKTVEAIHRLEKEGLLFAASSGRPVVGLKWLTDIVTKDSPFISFNGSIVSTAKTGKVILKQSVGAKHIQEVCEIGKSLGIETVVWSDSIMYTTGNSDAVAIYEERAKVKAVVLPSLKELENIEIVKALWSTTPEKAAKLQEELKPQFKDRLNVHTSWPEFLEFVDAKTSKAIAMEAIGKYYSISREDMIAIGDGWNDIDMIRYAGLGVAMGNAPDAIKKEANYIAPTNDENGVAHVIDKFMLN